MKKGKVCFTRPRRGVTLTEMIITVAIFSIMAVSVMPMFSLTRQGFSSFEAQTSLKTVGQKAINRMGHQLTECKRLFENVTNSNAFRNRATLTTPPSALSGSKLPILEESGVLSVSSSSFVASSVGNSLFFASVKKPFDADVLDSGSNSVSVRVDLFLFNYYFLASDAADKVGGQNKIDLWEWHSVEYADYDRLNSMTDGTKKSNTIQALVDKEVIWAWNSAATNVSSAFYKLDSGGGITAVGSHQIPEGEAKRMIKILTGVTGTGFRYGISPNSSDSYAPPHTVPHFATASNSFPSGFEVVAVGPNSARQIFIRLVMASEGAFKGIISSEQTLLVTARDLW